MLGLIGKKLGQTRVHDADGNVVSVTVVQAGPNHVLQVKTPARDGYSAVQLGFDAQKEQRLSKPLAGHLKKNGGAIVKRLREFRDFAVDVKPGDVVGPALFEIGDFVDAIGITKGRGFQGVVKRHGFGGGPSSHGSKGWHRRPGAIGCRTWPGWIRPGMTMPGHMGQVRRTVQNLEIMRVDETDQLLLIKGAIPGAPGDYVIIRESKKVPKPLAQKRRAEREAERQAALEAQAKAKEKGKGKARGRK
ncbi:MAG: 50S ribosomal protein L3 [Verrucomicrobiae bacterium]|nr:50S ribosomal protein L3 [Verrucomicrobiae bacterium]MCP5522794.1 50S ribosomal protein L3 [Verrucomicrobiales bacterium]